MKVGTRCGYCLLHRGYQQILRATVSEEVRFEALSQILKLLGDNFTHQAVPSFLGSERDRIIRQVTGCDDPYAEMKKKANAQALELLPKLSRLIEKKPIKNRLRTACKIACIGNVIEYDVPDHNPKITNLITNLDKEEFFIDDVKRFESIVENAHESHFKALYLTDNAGEIAFDRLLVKELISQGCHVTVSVKGGPSLNDALLSDAEFVGMHKVAKRIITTGTDAIGINLSESSQEFIDAYNTAHIIVAKGMANWETLTEYTAPCPTLFLFRTKCEPVASTVGAPLQHNIAKLVSKGWKF